MAIDTETEEVLWHSPTEYNPLRHCPPYLPGLPYRASRLSSEAKAEIQAFVKSASLGDMPRAPETWQERLPLFLSCLQALALLHQSHHWSTSGPDFYADHLLYERLYNESLPMIDAFAEKSIGTQVIRKVDALRQVQAMSEFMGIVGTAKTADEMVQVSLRAEILCVQEVNALMPILEEQMPLHEGFINLLGDIADKHESFVYLLRQRTQGGYSYDRR